MTRHNKLKRKTDRTRVRGLATITLSTGHVCKGTLVDVTKSGIAFSAVDPRLAQLKEQVVAIDLDILGWPTVDRCFAVVKRQTVKAKGRVVGCNFMSVPDDLLTLIESLRFGVI